MLHLFTSHGYFILSIYMYVTSRTQNTIVPELVSLFQAGGISSPFVQSCYKFTRPNFSNGWCWRHLLETHTAYLYCYVLWIQEPKLVVYTLAELKGDLENGGGWTFSDIRERMYRTEMMNYCEMIACGCTYQKIYELELVLKVFSVAIIRWIWNDLWNNLVIGCFSALQSLYVNIDR